MKNPQKALQLTKEEENDDDDKREFLIAFSRFNMKAKL